MYHQIQRVSSVVILGATLGLVAVKKMHKTTMDRIYVVSKHH